jgi:arginine/lysine/ornithine decarboxylase
MGDEALKITILTKPYGYKGTDIADICEKNGLFIEFADPDHAVLMLNDQNRAELDKIAEILLSIPKKEPIYDPMPVILKPTVAMSVRKATLSPSKTVKVKDSIGMIASSLTVSCPPAVPIVVSGEVITSDVVSALEYYGIEKISVVK